MALHPDLVEALAALKSRAVLSELVLADMLPSMAVFRRDLEKAGIPFLDASGRRADFHALRHTLCTNLGRADVPLPVRMEAMRHSDPKLTTRIYTDVSKPPTAKAFVSLPSFKQGEYTQKYTQLPGADGQNWSCSGTDGVTANADESVADKGDSHSLAQNDMVGQENKNGSKGRTRTYISALLVIAHSCLANGSGQATANLRAPPFSQLSHPSVGFTHLVKLTANYKLNKAAFATPQDPTYHLRTVIWNPSDGGGPTSKASFRPLTQTTNATWNGCGSPVHK